MRAIAPRSLLLAAAVVPLALTLTVPATAGAQLSSSTSTSGGFTDGAASDKPATVRSNPRTEYPQIQGLPEGVSINRVEWITNRRIAIYINSAAMPGEPIQVQMLLARDWFSNPTASFPQVWALDGLRARDDDSGWTLETNIEQQFADKNVNVILPIGGQSSFYSDWESADNGKHYMWESFLIDELIPVLRDGFRSNDTRAIVGLSMGGTAAMNLAERNPNLFKFVGSFSGYLDTTSAGMPEAITAAQADAGGFSSTAMWGPYGSQDWIDHDPKLGVDALKNMAVYVSAGNGISDYGQEDAVAIGPANAAGIGLEAISRMTTTTFVNRAEAAGVKVTTAFRPSGVHSWEYWQFELTKAWPYIADALQLSDADRGAECAPLGAIADATASGVIGTCVTNEYDVAGGKAEDFTGGTAYWSPETGAQAIFGAINAKYSSLEGPAGWLGFPTSTELTAPDGVGRFVSFQHGAIYWTPETGAQAIPTDMFNKWGTIGTGYERGDLGYPTAEAESFAGGLIQSFQGGLLTRAADGSNYWIHGAIQDKFEEVREAAGQPTSDEIPLAGGAFQTFDNGSIYWSPATGAHFLPKGAIFDAWAAAKWEQGEYGYPTSDVTQIPAGGEQVTFEHGTISQINGLIREEKN